MDASRATTLPPSPHPPDGGRPISPALAAGLRLGVYIEGGAAIGSGPAGYRRDAVNRRMRVVSGRRGTPRVKQAPRILTPPLLQQRLCFLQIARGRTPP